MRGLDNYEIAKDGLTVILVVSREDVFDEAREVLAGWSVKRRDGAGICGHELIVELAAVL
jgi:hypothetical protein